jgi:dienelactone hydrolase
MHKFVLFLPLFLGAAACTGQASNFAPPNPPGAHGVGLRVVQQYDHARVYRQKIDLTNGRPATGARMRPLQTLIWYPAKTKPGERLHYQDYGRLAATETVFARSAADIDHEVAVALEENYPDLSAGQRRSEMAQAMLAQRDAPAAPGSFPVVIYAPGSSSSAQENADLCEYLASHGYIVLATPSMGAGTRSMTIDLEGAEAQAADISFLAGYAATLAQADSTRIAVLGYSMGGLANVLAAARDDRIGALVALDGSVRYHAGIAQAAAYATPERLALPMLYMGGKPSTAEAMNRNKQVPTYSLLNQMKYADLYNVTMYTMEHAAFQSESLRLGPEQRFGEYSRAEAALAYGWMEKYVLAFLNAYLKDDAKALAFLNGAPKDNGVPAHLMAVDVHRAEGPPPTLATLASEFAKRNYTDVAGIYQEMHKTAPGFKPGEHALISWGEPFLEQKRYAQAIDIFALTNALYPDSGRTAFYLALAYDRNQDSAHAIEHYQRVLTYIPDMPEAKQSISRLRAQAPRAPASP